MASINKLLNYFLLSHFSKKLITETDNANTKKIRLAIASCLPPVSLASIWFTLHANASRINRVEAYMHLVQDIKTRILDKEINFLQTELLLLSSVN